ncbi:hypothetical protein KP509_37G021700 [Ceratopteris richardii]|uniref:Sister chromatid cohesion protein PDS5 homolog A n=2 Tax=Ceratopteris richardii TaxID=49495 RepID=A0A8T2Q884_CERRI|nr:hypothetical protein KP509_37G021700 [Ceratopteris richardii]KAH7279482.1 hypothetical protein KP509_37G021700 [Ceratopteris richardii]
MTRIVQRLSAIGKQLTQPPHTKDAILKQLKQAAEMLSEMKQSQDAKASLQPLTNALALPAILKHKDKDVRLFATSCIMEILRIVAPDAPYSDKELQDIFHEVVSAFEGLNETSSSSFSRRSAILEIMANLRIGVVMLDVGCDELIPEMFKIFFSVVSDKHPSSLFNAMQAIMAALLEESENIPEPILDAILNNLLKHKKGVSSSAHKLAVGVVRQCADKLEPYVQRLLTSIMLEGGKAEIDFRLDYHDIILEIYQCAPDMLLAVIPNLTQELVNDKVAIRLKAVKLLGRLFALPGRYVAKEYRHLFLEFLKRFTDKAVEVRLAMLDCSKDCLRASPSGNEAADILAGLDDRVLDSEESIRLRTVAVVCELAKQNHKWVPVSILKHIADRLRDKKVGVRKEAFNRLAEVYRAYAAKCGDGLLFIDNQLEWIPGKLLRCCYDKDVKEFRPAGIELVFVEKLFPSQLSVSERAKHWIAMYSCFEDIDKRALAKILVQKKRLQEDISMFLKLRQREKDVGEEQHEMQQLVKEMNLLFVEDSKVEEHFQKLHKMKDNKIFKALSDLLNPLTSYMESLSVLDDLLKRLGEHHPQYEFMKSLAVRSSYMLFSKEHVKEVIDIASEENINSDNTMSALSLIADIAGVFPDLLLDVKEKVVRMLLEGDDRVKEIVSEILAKAGSAVFGNSAIGSSIEQTLQKLCLEGTRKQAKCAVAALVATSADGGFKPLSVLFGRLVECLQEDSANLPTILESISCVAQREISIFETQEDYIVRFVVRSLLQKDAETLECEDWDNPSKMCQLKIFGMKTLVNSFLPYKQHTRRRLRGLLGLLTKVLPVGEIADTVKSSENDKSHLRLASAKGLLRLARRWDSQIPEPAYHLCLMTAQDSSLNVRQGFLRKLHQYLKDHSLNHKYASGYALFAVDASKEILSEAKHYLNEFIETARLDAKTMQKSASQSDTYFITYNPEYVIAYLVHFLAYHPCFPHPETDNADLYEPIYRYLLFYLRPLVHVDQDDSSKGSVENIPAILAIFRTIKKADDALGGNKTHNLHIICDIGILITKELGSSSLYAVSYPAPIPLPNILYKVRSDDTEDTDMVDGCSLPACLMDEDVLSNLWSRSFRNGQVQMNTGGSAPTRKEKVLSSELSIPEDQKSLNVSVGAVKALVDAKAEDKAPTVPEKHNVSEKLRRSSRILSSRLDYSALDETNEELNVQKDRADSIEIAQEVAPSDAVAVVATVRSSVSNRRSEVRVLRNRNVILDEQAQGSTTCTENNDFQSSPAIGTTNAVEELSNEALKKRDAVLSQDDNKGSCKVQKLNMEDSPRSHPVPSEAGEVQRMESDCIAHQEVQGRSLSRPDIGNAVKCPQMASEAGKKSRTVGSDEGRILRKRAVVLGKQLKENAIPGSLDDSSKSPPVHVPSKGSGSKKLDVSSEAHEKDISDPDKLVPEESHRSSTRANGAGEVGEVQGSQTIKPKRNAVMDGEGSNRCLPDHQNINPSRSSRTSSRLSNEVAESTVSEMEDQKSGKGLGRVLRGHGSITVKQGGVQASLDSDDETNMVTWRSRRRKVQ